MSVPAVGWARQQGREKNLPTFARILLLTLADILGATGKLCPSHPYLARETGLAEKTVRKFLNVLKEHGLIDWVNSPGNPTQYRLLRYEPPADATPVRRAVVTPVRRAVVNGGRPGKSEGGPRQDRAATPVRLTAEPSKNQEKNQDAREEDFQTHEEDKATDPQLVANVITDLQRNLRLKAYPPGRFPIHDADQQQAAVAPHRPKPNHLTGMQLAAARRAAGMPVPHLMAAE